MPMKETILGLRLNLFIKATKAKKERDWGITRLLIFLIVKTRPNINFFIAIITCFAMNASHLYFKVIKTILQYLKEFINWGITYSEKKKLIVEEYSNFD